MYLTRLYYRTSCNNYISEHIEVYEQVDIFPPILTTGLPIVVTAVGPYPSILLAFISIV